MTHLLQIYLWGVEDVNTHIAFSIDSSVMAFCRIHLRAIMMIPGIGGPANLWHDTTTTQLIRFGKMMCIRLHIPDPPTCRYPASSTRPISVIPRGIKAFDLVIDSL